eukprot:scaffold261360_cov70-Cyclotella_meneghiniana.AAC.1
MKTPLSWRGAVTMNLQLLLRSQPNRRLRMGKMMKSLQTPKNNKGPEASLQILKPLAGGPVLSMPGTRKKANQLHQGHEAPLNH